MAGWDTSETVKTQYADDTNLSARIKLHARHSTNPQGFGAWLFEQYDFSHCTRILELGCGNGAQWAGRMDALPPDAILVLSDFSHGMVRTAWNKYASVPRVLVQRIDIQDIPFPDGTFDRVIANHMLYHVPDLSGALREVFRVTKEGGIFYAGTVGEGGMHPYLHRAIQKIHPDTAAFSQPLSFTLQNGKAILDAVFPQVRRVDYIDSLRITHTQDLMDWIQSGIVGTALSGDDLGKLYAYFEDIRLQEGAISIPKENGLFISQK